MSNPRSKRQFAGAASDPAQRTITSFFSNSSSSSTDTPTTPTGDSQPQLPDNIQSRLTLVGMRIRKSIPEGHKTGTYNSFSLWDENDNYDTTSSSSQHNSPTMPVDGQRSRANAISTPRELLPFCGAIHDIGGLAVQPQRDNPYSRPTPPIAPLYHPLFALDQGNLPNDPPELTLSQSSIDSDASFMSSAQEPRAARKRSFVEDGEEDQASNSAMDAWLRRDGLSSPWNHNDNNNGRLIAVPRKSNRFNKFRFTSGSAPETIGASGEQENVMVVDSDFEEADFLDHKAWEMDTDT